LSRTGKGIINEFFYSELMLNVIKKIRNYKKEDIIFTKKNYKNMLQDRKLEEKKVIEDLLSLKGVKHIESEKVTHLGEKETRYKVYAVYSNSRGRFYSITFNKHLKIISTYRIGRKTLNRWRKKLKEEKK